MTQLLPGVKREDLAPANDPAEGLRIAQEATRRLAGAYGGRLREVVLFGSWIRSEAHEESDVDLLVILDAVVDRPSERDRLVDVLYDLEVDSHRAIQAFPVAEANARADEDGFIGVALREGKPLLGGAF